jgi:hypothetical protein
LPKLSFVTINIYDVLGGEVATLVNEEKPAGSYELTWNAANLPSGVSAKGGYASGVYFYRLQVVDPESSSGQGFVETKKMILLR